MEPEDSLLCLQQPATGPFPEPDAPFPEPDASSPHLSTLFPYEPF
jgi:hypothetical protein